MLSYDLSLLTVCCDKTFTKSDLWETEGLFVLHISGHSPLKEARAGSPARAGHWRRPEAKAAHQLASHNLPIAQAHLPRSGAAHLTTLLTNQENAPTGLPTVSLIKKGIFSFEISSSQMILACAKLTLKPARTLG